MRPESREIYFTAEEWEQMMNCLRRVPVDNTEDAVAVGCRLAICLGWTKRRVCLPIVLQVMHAVQQQFTNPVDDLESVAIHGI